MENSRKKPILVGVIVVCFLSAGVITWVTCRPKGGIPQSFAYELTWVKCRNEACEHEYEITKKEYFEYVEQHNDPRSAEAPALICPECGQDSVYRAVKCGRCGLVFELGSLPGEIEDRCPKCGYSQLEADQNKAGR